jgi:hypothetical protein
MNQFAESVLLMIVLLNPFILSVYLTGSFAIEMIMNGLHGWLEIFEIGI